MIGADSPQTGVQWDTLRDAYWQQHYLGATRPLAPSTRPTATPSVATMIPTRAVTPSATAALTETTADPSATATPSGPPSSPVSTWNTVGPSLPSPTGPALVLQAGMTVTVLHDAPIYADPSDSDRGTPPIDAATPSMPLTVVRMQGGWVAVAYDDGTQDG